MANPSEPPSALAIDDAVCYAVDMKRVLLALCLCFPLLSCQQQQQQLVYAWQPAQSVAEDTPVKLSVGQVEFKLQILPNKGGVSVTSFFHPISDPKLVDAIPTGTFILKDDAYGVESQLRDLLKQGYKQWDIDHGREEIQGEVPYIAYRIGGQWVYRSILHFGASGDGDTPLNKLNRACSEANIKELPSPRH